MRRQGVKHALGKGQALALAALPYATAAVCQGCLGQQAVEQMQQPNGALLGGAGHVDAQGANFTRQDGRSRG